MKIWLIRHGMTQGNKEKRYIGRGSDEPLCEEGRLQLQGRNYGTPDLVVVSPMLRTRQSADILFEDVPCVCCEELAECDFGRFEGKNYRELLGDADYQRWIDSNGTLPFPDGEDSMEFRRRSVEGFLRMVRQYADKETLAFVVHGGTIMSVLEKLAKPERMFYEYQIDNGQAYVAEWTQEHDLRILEKKV